MRLNKKKLGDILVENNVISYEQLEKALIVQKEQKPKSRLGDTLISLGYLTEQQLIEVLEFQLGVPHINLNKHNLDPSIVRIIPEKIAIQYQVIPIKKEGDTLTVAMADPLDYYAIDDLRMTTGFQIQPFFSTKEELSKVINRYYGMQEAVNEIMKNLPKEEDLDNTQIQSDDAPVSRMVNSIIKNAVKMRASDIHFDPQERELKVRYRIDGVLRTEQTLEKNMHGVVIARIKIISNIDIAEKRLPQDGRFNMIIDFRSIDVRVSTIPTAKGEKVVLRILDFSQGIKKIEELGFSNSQAYNFRKMVSRSNGIVLITGPTGSGKTSTLYSLLTELNSEDVNIVTVEDPIEYQIEGINQIQINEKIDLTFARGLRSILRQDPNIIMVGEIRDIETAEMAIRSALTGHLVLSTIHTNDAASTVSRLIDMGIEPYLISSSLSGVVAQRLVRRICPDCKISYTPSPDEQQILDRYNIDKSNIFIGQGCSNCNMTGYKGRIGIYELFKLDDNIKQMIVDKKINTEINKYLSEMNYTTILEDGLKKVEQGITTITEVINATMND